MTRREAGVALVLVLLGIGTVWLERMKERCHIVAAKRPLMTVHPWIMRNVSEAVEVGDPLTKSGFVAQATDDEDAILTGEQLLKVIARRFERDADYQGTAPSVAWGHRDVLSTESPLRHGR